MGTDYYKLDSRWATFGECWRIIKNPLEFAIAALLKLVGVKVPANVAFAYPHRLTRVADEAVPQRVLDLTSPTASAAEDLGFEHQFWFMLPRLGDSRGYAHQMRGPDSRSILVISFVQTSQGGIVDEITAHGFISQLEAGTYLATSGSKRQENSSPECDEVYLPNRPLTEVYDHHCERLRQSASKPLEFFDEVEYEELTLRGQQLHMDYNIERGLFREMGNEELAKLRREHQHTEPAEVPPTHGSVSWLSALQWFCWFCLVFGGYSYFFKGEAANQAQLIFRLTLIGIGLAGIVILQVVKMARGQT